MATELALRPMSTSQVLDRTFQLYRSHFWLFAGIAALPPALTLIGQGLAAVWVWITPKRRALESAEAAAAVLGVAMFVVLYLAGSTLATGATVFAVSRAHLASPVSISQSYRAVGSRVLRLLGITFLVSLMAGGALLLGYLLLAVPTFLAGSFFRSAGPFASFMAILVGIAAMVASLVWAIRIFCRYALAVPACVVERLPVIPSLRRSKLLSSHSLFRIFLIYLLLLILQLALGAAFSIPDYIEAAFRSGKELLPLQIWDIISSFLAGTLAGPIATIAISLVYYDQRVRKEAFDLQLMMEAIGQAPQQAAGAAAPGVG